MFYIFDYIEIILNFDMHFSEKWIIDAATFLHAVHKS